ncbi:carbohydrate ABC transporter permease [Paenibacillus sp. J2TS4]|uniref:carbohydrate ABC transporter permease n=1 Tax=Paenibacillus sp. J2TS4 TaxID=2807194 RepID=UPI001B159120|nr:carbohydrate ABC transporter permease [Paenibacillus sp. J2TS4]GIP32750.1 protein LplC [Paenibacillus sp. J2TS4]
MPTYKSDRVFQWVNGLFLILACLTMIAPLIHLAAISLSSPVYANAKLVYLWPKGFNLTVYEQIFGMDTLWRALGVSVYMCIMGILVFLILTTSISYSLSRPIMPGRRLVLRAILVTFVFTSPLIPNYLVIKSLGMENTLWALIVPGALGAYSVIIMKTFLQGISSELFDAAKIDGCSEYGIYARIALPLSKPVIATLSLFHVVGLWNAYFGALIYIRDKKLYPLQLVLRSLILEQDTSGTTTISTEVAMEATPEMMKAGVILFTTIPILMVYPFLQKYFVKGALLGSLKE